MYVEGKVDKVQGSSVTVKALGLAPNMHKTDVFNLRPNYTQVSYRDCSFILFAPAVILLKSNLKKVRLNRLIYFSKCVNLCFAVSTPFLQTRVNGILRYGR